MSGGSQSVVRDGSCVVVLGRCCTIVSDGSCVHVKYGSRTVV